MQYLHIKYSTHYIQLSTGNLKCFQHLLFWLQQKSTYQFVELNLLIKPQKQQLMQVKTYRRDKITKHKNQDKHKWNMKNNKNIVFPGNIKSKYWNQQ